jgi:hypothetical protein
MEQSNQPDHDLLIQINTKLERVILDVKELNDNTTLRVTHLEDEKVDKKEFQRSEDDKERRLRALEKWRWGLVGAFAIITALISLIEIYKR